MCKIVGFVGENGGHDTAVFQIREKLDDARIRFCIVSPSFCIFVSVSGNEVFYRFVVEAVFGEDARYKCIDAVAYKIAIGINWEGGEFEAGEGCVGGVCDVGEGV